MKPKQGVKESARQRQSEDNDIFDTMYISTKCLIRQSIYTNRFVKCPESTNPTKNDGPGQKNLPWSLFRIAENHLLYVAENHKCPGVIFLEM